jgi:hypothetical protein
MLLSKKYLLIFTLAIYFLFGAAYHVYAATLDNAKVWTTVGSDGTVDETDVSKLFFNNSVVQTGQTLVNQAASVSILALPQAQSAVIRYNVTPVDGLFFDSGTPFMQLRYLSTGSQAQVLARLIEVDLQTGLETVRLTFNSSAFPASNIYHVQQVYAAGGYIGCLNPSWHFDFVNKAYYISAKLSRSTLVVNSSAGIQMIKVGYTSCFSGF